MTNSDKFGADAKLLEVSNLAVEFDTYGGVVQAVRGVSFSVSKGKTLAIVGESGCGKSVSVQSMMGLIPVPPGRITSGSALLNGKEILGQTTVDGKEIRGADIGMIFQDPMTSLNPTMTIGDQIAEPLQVHNGFSYKEAFEEAVRLLDMTKIPEAAKRAKQYPFEFSGGMLQRAMIAMAIMVVMVVVATTAAANFHLNFVREYYFDANAEPQCCSSFANSFSHPKDLSTFIQSLFFLNAFSITSKREFFFFTRFIFD